MFWFMRKKSGRCFEVNELKEIAIEVTNACNLECPLCENRLMERPIGFMNLDKHNKLINEVKNKAKRIDYSINAEPLLHPKIIEMISYSSKKGLETFLGTNGIFLSKHAKGLVESGLDYTNISMDGATKETYDKYRVGKKENNNNFEMLKQGIKDLCIEKEKQKTEYPDVQISYLVNRHSESEIPLLLDWAKEIGVNRVLLKSMHFYWVGQDEQAIERAKVEWLPEDERYWRTFDKKELPKCAWAHEQCVVLWDGRLGSCCNDILGRTTFANVFDLGFQKAYDLKLASYNNTKIWTRELPQCNGCSTGLKDYGRFIELNKRKINFRKIIKGVLK